MTLAETIAVAGLVLALLGSIAAVVRWLVHEWSEQRTYNARAEERSTRIEEHAVAAKLAAVQLRGEVVPALSELQVSVNALRGAGEGTARLAAEALRQAQVAHTRLDAEREKREGLAGKIERLDERTDSLRRTGRFNPPVQESVE